MVPFALLLVQAQTVTLAPFFDDGGTKTRETEPLLLPLVRSGKRLTTEIKFGSQAFQAWIVEAGSDRSLFVDLNRNGKPDTAEKVALTKRDGTLRDGSTLTAYQGDFSLPVAGGAIKYSTRFLISNTKDPSFAPIRDRLALIPQFGFLGQASFGGKKMRIGIRGGDPRYATLLIDRDADGTLGTVPAEAYPIDKPFNIDGRSYRVASFTASGTPRISFAASSTRVAEVPMPPDLRVGKVAPSLTGKTLSGKTLQFPKSFASKIVMLDVWATWCGPCVGEIPYMKSAYAKFKRRGFEIVSFSIDDPGMQTRVAAFTKSKGTTWTQVFEGKGWQSPVCQRYNITGIPFMLLVDGSTGKILATEDSLRGPSMEPTIDGILSLRGR